MLVHSQKETSIFRSEIPPPSDFLIKKHVPLGTDRINIFFPYSFFTSIFVSIFPCFYVAMLPCFFGFFFVSFLIFKTFFSLLSIISSVKVLLDLILFLFLSFLSLSISISSFMIFMSIFFSVFHSRFVLPPFSSFFPFFLCFKHSSLYFFSPTFAARFQLLVGSQKMLL